MALINFGNTPPEAAPAGSNFPLIPKGDYMAVIAKAEAGVSKTSGNPQIVLTVRLSDPPYAGRRLQTWFPYTTEFGRTKLRTLLLSMGFAAEDISGEKDFDEGCLVDDAVIVTVDHEVYLGEVREKVRTVVGAGAYQSPTERVAVAAGASRSDPDLPFLPESPA